VAPTRNDAVARGSFARKIEAPVIMRRTPVGAGGEGRSLDGAATSGPRPNRDGQAAPGRGDDSNAAPTRISNGRIERPSRTPDYRPAERVTAPPPRSTAIDRNSPDRATHHDNEEGHHPH